MKKTLITLSIIALSETLKAQTKPKEYATADPKKVYEFKLSMPAEAINKLANLLNYGANAIMDTDIQAKIAKDQTITATTVIQELYNQLRTQIVVDSIKSVKKPGKQQ